MKNSNNTIGNRTRDLPICSAVPQPTAPPRAPTERGKDNYKIIKVRLVDYGKINRVWYFRREIRGTNTAKDLLDDIDSCKDEYNGGDCIPRS